MWKSRVEGDGVKEEMEWRTRKSEKKRGKSVVLNRFKNEVHFVNRQIEQIARIVSVSVFTSLSTARFSCNPFVSVWSKNSKVVRSCASNLLLSGYFLPASSACDRVQGSPN